MSGLVYQKFEPRPPALETNLLPFDQLADQKSRVYIF